MNTIFSSNSSMMISRFFTILLLWIGTGYVINQTITPGELMSFYTIIGYFTGPVSGLIGANKSYQNAKIAADRLFEIMDLEADDGEERFNLDRDEVGDIQLINLKFRYGTRVNVFENLNLTIPSASLTAIVGESGSGKSTVASLIKRLYPIEEGSILIGKYDLNAIADDSLNRHIGIVPQQVDLFSGTVLENIALGEFQPDTSLVMKLAEEIGALKFINELPRGLNSYLGENGVNLSGGQRQRLAILRALYPNPQVIIFDEATSALDRKSEELIINTMLRLRNQGKTVIAITHRMAAAKAADKVVLLDKGAILCQGSHEELIKTEKTYFNFWSEVTYN